MSKYQDYGVDQSLDDGYGEGGARFPGIGYDGKKDQKYEGYFFVSDVDGSAPGPFMELHPDGQNWLTQRLRWVPAEWRRSNVATTGHGARASEVRYSQFGKIKDTGDKFAYSHIQVAGVFVDRPDEIYVLGLPKVTKVSCWSNDPDNQYGQQNMTLGVWQLLRRYTEEFNDQHGTKFSPLGTFIVDLVQQYMKGKPNYVTMGRSSQTQMLPFTLDMSLKDKDERFPADRVVDRDVFDTIKNLRRSVLAEWRAEWHDKANQDQYGRIKSEMGGSGQDQVDDRYPEEDDIPF